MALPITKELIETGFARVSGSLSQKGKAEMSYTINVKAGNRYRFHTASTNLGENLKLELKNEKGKIIAKALSSPGSDDPLLFYRFKSSEQVKLVVSLEKDKRNKGETSFNLAITNEEDYLEYHNTSDQDIKKTQGSDNFIHAFKNITNITPDRTNSLVSEAWQQIKGSEITISSLDNLLASTTSDGSTVSASEIETLQSIANEIDTYITPLKRDYYNYIFGAAIGDNPANQYFTGGANKKTGRISLGNLQEGFSNEKVKLLREKWFQGKDLPLAQGSGDRANNTPASKFKNYGHAKGEMYSGKPNYKQVVQGTIGDCWFLSALNAVANTSEGVQEMFIDNEDGTYGVRFYAPGGTGESAWVTVNKQLPVYNDAPTSLKMAGSYKEKYAKNGCTNKPIATNLIWAGLAEKALAQVSETGLLRRPKTENSYSSLSGGYGNGLDFITGLKSTESFNHDADGAGHVTRFGGAYHLANTYDFDTFQGNKPKEDALLLVSYANWSGSSTLKNLVPAHMYSVIDFKYDPKDHTQSNGYYIVANPWGTVETDYEAVFQVPEDKMRSLYNSGEIGLIWLNN